MLSVGKVEVFLAGLLQYLAKNMAYVVQKILGENVFKIRIQLFMKKALVVGPLVEEFFFGFP